MFSCCMASLIGSLVHAQSLQALGTVSQYWLVGQEWVTTVRLLCVCKEKAAPIQDWSLRTLSISSRPLWLQCRASYETAVTCIASLFTWPWICAGIIITISTFFQGTLFPESWEDWSQVHFPMFLFFLWLILDLCYCAIGESLGDYYLNAGARAISI